MMNQSEFHNLSLEELEQKAGKLHMSNSILAFVLALMFFHSVFLSFDQGSVQFSLIIPIALFYFVLRNFQKIKRMKEEMDLRKA